MKLTTLIAVGFCLPLVNAEWQQDPRCPGYGLPRSFFDGNLTEYEILQDELTNAKLLNGGTSDGGGNRALRGSLPPRQLTSDDPVKYFQLKMHWEQGYCWQAEWIERKWCLECEGGSCGTGDLLYIKECDGASAQRFVYEPIAGSGGGRIKPYTEQDLCWERVSSRTHTLQPCATMSCRQIIKGFTYDRKFEMHPNGKPFDCLENHHHPKADEVIYASDCWTARSHKTSFWGTYNVKYGSGDDEDAEEGLPPGSTTINNLGQDICDDDDNKCGLCQGDCDEDDQCQDGLECFQRDDDEEIPGCSGEAKSGLDVCYDPTGNYTLPPTPAPKTAPPTAAEVVVPLTGDCEFQFPSSAPSDPPTIAPTVSMRPSERPSSFPSVAPSGVPSMAPTEEWKECELDDGGFYGEVGLAADFVDFTYQLVIDPAVNATVEEVVDSMERDILRSLLPSLFEDNCTRPEVRRLSDRMLALIPVGASIAPRDEIIDGAICQGELADSEDCVVVMGSMTVFTYRDQAYDEFVMPIIEESMNTGLFNYSHPAVLATSYLGSAEDVVMSEQDGGGGGGVQRPGLFAILAVGLLAVLFVGAFVMKKRRSQRKDNKTSDELLLPATAPPTSQGDEFPPSVISVATGSTGSRKSKQELQETALPTPQQSEAQLSCVGAALSCASTGQGSSESDKMLGEAVDVSQSSPSLPVDSAEEASSTPVDSSKQIAFDQETGGSGEVNGSNGDDFQEVVSPEAETGGSCEIDGSQDDDFQEEVVPEASGVDDSLDDVSPDVADSSREESLLLKESDIEKPDDLLVDTSFVPTVDTSGDYDDSFETNETQSNDSPEDKVFLEANESPEENVPLSPGRDIAPSEERLLKESDDLLVDAAFLPAADAADDSPKDNSSGSPNLSSLENSAEKRAPEADDLPEESLLEEAEDLLVDTTFLPADGAADDSPGDDVIESKDLASLNDSPEDDTSESGDSAKLNYLPVHVDQPKHVSAPLPRNVETASMEVPDGLVDASNVEDEAALIARLQQENAGLRKQLLSTSLVDEDSEAVHAPVLMDVSKFPNESIIFSPKIGKVAGTPPSLEQSDEVSSLDTDASPRPPSTKKNVTWSNQSDSSDVSMEA